MSLLNTFRFIARHPLNADARVSAFARYLRWQIGSRLVSAPVIVPFAGTAKLMVEPGMTGSTGNIYTGLHEFQEMSFLLHLLRPGDLFVDVGANVGTYTVLAAAVIGARCLSFEPVPGTFRHLLNNVGVNRVSTLCDCRNIAIGRSESTLKITTMLDTVNHVLAEDEPNGDSSSIEVPIASLNRVVGELRPKLIKIDVEGYETEVIGGASELLAQPSLLAVIMELNGNGNRYGFDEQRVHHQMLAYGFTPYGYSPFGRVLSQLNGKNQLGNNTIYVKNVGTVRKLLQEAPKISVHGKLV